MALSLFLEPAGRPATDPCKVTRRGEVQFLWASATLSWNLHVNYQTNALFGKPEFELAADEPTSDVDLLKTAPVQNRLAIFALFAREQRRFLEADRVEAIDYLYALADDSGLCDDFGIDAIQLELSRVFG